MKDRKRQQRAAHGVPRAGIPARAGLHPPAGVGERLRRLPPSARTALGAVPDLRRLPGARSNSRTSASRKPARQRRPRRRGLRSRGHRPSRCTASVQRAPPDDTACGSGLSREAFLLPWSQVQSIAAEAAPTGLAAGAAGFDGRSAGLPGGHRPGIVQAVAPKDGTKPAGTPPAGIALPDLLQPPSSPTWSRRWPSSTAWWCPARACSWSGARAGGISNAEIASPVIVGARRHGRAGAVPGRPACTATRSTAWKSSVASSHSVDPTRLSGTVIGVPDRQRVQLSRAAARYLPDRRDLNR